MAKDLKQVVDRGKTDRKFEGFCSLDQEGYNTDGLGDACDPDVINPGRGAEILRISLDETDGSEVQFSPSAELRTPRVLRQSRGDSGLVGRISLFPNVGNLRLRTARLAPARAQVPRGWSGLDDFPVFSLAIRDFTGETSSLQTGSTARYSESSAIR